MNDILMGVVIGLGYCVLILSLIYFRSVRHWDENGELRRHIR